MIITKMRVAKIEGLIRESLHSESDYQDARLLHAIQERVKELLAHEPELLFSYLYRLDVSEHKVRHILKSPEGNTSRKLAELILERQMARIRTKQNNPQVPIEGWQW